jgi:hypothetical protein
MIQQLDLSAKRAVIYCMATEKQWHVIPSYKVSITQLISIAIN